MVLKNIKRKILGRKDLWPDQISATAYGAHDQVHFSRSCRKIATCVGNQNPNLAAITVPIVNVTRDDFKTSLFKETALLVRLAIVGRIQSSSSSPSVKVQLQ